MSSSAINAQLFQAKIGSIQNQADSSAVYSNGVWSFKNSTALTSVTITDAGNVGIGVTSPLRPLDILQKGNDTTPAILLRGHTTGADGARTAVISTVSSDANNWANLQINAQQHIWTYQGTERMRIDASGNVGIGTASPSTVLDLRRGAGVGVAVALSANGNAPASGNFELSQAGDNSCYVWNRSNNIIGFGTNNTERARIDASGNFMVGMTVANEITQNGFFAGGLVKGYVAASMAGSTNGQGNSYHLYSTGAGAYRFYVGLGGTIFATSTSISAISDVSLKENVRDLETGLSQVLALKPRRFDWKEETQIEQKNVAGFIAQEVEEVLPELVYEYKYNQTETKKSLKMGDMLPTLVKAIQEQQAQIEALRAEVAALKAP